MPALVDWPPAPERLRLLAHRAAPLSALLGGLEVVQPPDHRHQALQLRDHLLGPVLDEVLLHDRYLYISTNKCLQHLIKTGILYSK